MSEYYWYFCEHRSDGGYLTNDLWAVRVYPGLTVKIEGHPELCRYGLHASKRATDALRYAPGSHICLVTLGGNIIHGDDKSAATERTVIAEADATRVLHEFAIWCAEQALALVDRPDPRSIEALAVKRRWLDGQATDDELITAQDVAWAAVRAAAGATARYAAQDAAWAAAQDAAGDAARDAAWAAAQDAAGDAARDAQDAELERRMLALLEDVPAASESPANKGV